MFVLRYILSVFNLIDDVCQGRCPFGDSEYDAFLE